MSVSLKPKSIKRLSVLVVVVAFSASLVAYLFPPTSAFAANITPRSLTLEDGTVGGSTPGDGNSAHTVKHLFTFTLPSTSGIQSIVFKYCKTADIDIGGTCDTPTGLSTTGATLGATTGIGSQFTIGSATTNGTIVMTSGSAVSPDGTSSASIELDKIVNPDGSDCGVGATNCTFYVQIATYATTDGTGTATDKSTVAAAVATPIKLTGTMPESLIFCTGQSISETNSIPDCSTATGGNIEFSKLFSPTASVFATSQMAASTNASQGYVITVSGPTLTSGTNSIPALTPPAATASIGTGQFGMNLAADNDAATLTPASANITPVSNTASQLLGQATANFATGGDAATAKYAFDATGLNTVAKSDFGGTAGPTNSQIYTATYIVNVSGAQPAGTYTTTLTYVCTATF